MSPTDKHSPSLRFAKGVWYGVGVGFLIVFIPNSLHDNIKYITWPIVVVWCVYLLRDQISSLLERVIAVEGKGFRAEFASELEQLEKVATEHPDSPLSDTSFDDVQSQKRSTLHRIAALSPYAAIVEAWIEVESAIYSVAKYRNREDLIGNRGPTPAISWLQATQGVSNEVLQAIDQLRKLRNLSSHALPRERETINYNDAIKAIDIALNICKSLDNATID